MENKKKLITEKQTNPKKPSPKAAFMQALPAVVENDILVIYAAIQNADGFQNHTETVKDVVEVPSPPEKPPQTAAGVHPSVYFCVCGIFLS